MRQISVAAGLAVLAITLYCASAHGVVQTIDATAQSGVVQYLPDDVVNSDAAFESLDESTSNLPLVAEARLSSDSDPAAPSGATAVTTFNDPRASETEDPAEFAMDLVAFSLDAVTRYEGSGTSTETRQIVFTPEEMDAEPGTALLATSRFFVDGFLIVWGDLDPLVGPTNADVQFRVYQTRPGQDRQIVMESTLSISQNSDGTPLLQADGGLVTDNVVLIDTLGSIPELGNAYLVILPQLSIPYTYEAAVGETFTLEAEVESHVANQPSTGAAIALGAPLADLLQSIGNEIGEPLSQADALARTGGVVPVPVKPLQGGKGTQVQVLTSPASAWERIIPCGGLGVESAMLPAFTLMLTFAGRRRWR